MGVLKIRAYIRETGQYADFRVGMLEQENHTKETYKYTWEAKTLKKLFIVGYKPPAGPLPIAVWDIIHMPFEIYEDLCKKGRRYAKKHGLTFVNQLL